MDSTIFVDHGEEFRPRQEPETTRLVSEEYTNERDRIQARQTDHEQLQPLPAPGARAARQTFAATERVTEPWDPVISGNKVDINPEVRPDPLQDMRSQDAYHVNTFRVEAEPWDTNLVG